MSAGVLDGLRVVEFSQMIAAPYCGLTLGDMGADVIKVEPPEGDFTRELPPTLEDGSSGYFRMLNRGKRSVTVDLHDGDAAELARRLVDSADVVVESLGGAEGDALSYEEAASRNPKLIWCSITGYGRGRRERTLDPALQASMGMMAMNGEPDRPPMRLPIPLVDFGTGMYAIQAILAALLRVERGGEGGLLDCAMVDAAATLASSAGVYALSGDEPLRRMGTQNPWYVPAGNFEASDGKWVQLIAVNSHHWEALCLALGRPEWLQDERFADNDSRLEHRGELNEMLTASIAGSPALHWQTAITEAGGFCRVIKEIEDAWTDPLLAERGLLGSAEMADRGGASLPVASLAHDGSGPLAAAPELGEHTDELSAELS